MKINRDVPQTLADKNNFERMLNNTENLYNTNDNTDFIYVRNNSTRVPVVGFFVVGVGRQVHPGPGPPARE